MFPQQVYLTAAGDFSESVEEARAFGWDEADGMVRALGERGVRAWPVIVSTGQDVAAERPAQLEPVRARERGALGSPRRRTDWRTGKSNCGVD